MSYSDDLLQMIDGSDAVVLLRKSDDPTVLRQLSGRETLANRHNRACVLCGYRPGPNSSIRAAEQRLTAHWMRHSQALKKQHGDALAALETACAMQGLGWSAWIKAHKQWPTFCDLVEQFFPFRPGVPSPAARRFWVACGGELGPGQKRRLR